MNVTTAGSPWVTPALTKKTTELTDLVRLEVLPSLAADTTTTKNIGNGRPRASVSRIILTLLPDPPNP